MVFDEALVKYQPSKKVKTQAENNEEPIPVIHIARKPAKNGLLIFHTATYIDHPARNSVLPFIVDTAPFTKVGEAGAAYNATKMINR